MKTAIEVLDAFENIRRAQHAGVTHQRFPAHYLWAVLIARIYEAFPLVGPAAHAGV